MVNCEMSHLRTLKSQLTAAPKGAPGATSWHQKIAEKTRP